MVTEVTRWVSHDGMEHQTQESAENRETILAFTDAIPHKVYDHIPISDLADALLVMLKLGWRFVPPSQADAARHDNT